MPTPVVLVTESEFRRGESVFASAADFTCLAAPRDEDALVRAILAHGASHAIVGSFMYREALYTALSRGAVLARYGVGHENIDKARATAQGLLCTNTPGVLDQSVAELTLLFILAAARQLPERTGEMREGQWRPGTGVELQGKTVALIGTGPIARAVARAATAGFGMRAIGCGREAPAAPSIPPGGDFVRTTRDFGEAVGEADFVSLHIPGTAENLHYVDRRRLSLLRPDTWLINTARGAVVDEAAMFEALAERRIAGAALDVFAREPYEPVEPARDLRTLPNVILTPHIGSNTVEANRRMAERALRNVRLGAARDYPAMDLLNPAVVAQL
ncbi:MAG TPA: NAD(P)-dependent oxidoreductase [Vicinamibacterales bacterium]|nr:NAD(P)-dependent oxidoreductase [Vicinamibacterales bacterium]